MIMLMFFLIPFLTLLQRHTPHKFQVEGCNVNVSSFAGHKTCSKLLCAENTAWSGHWLDVICYVYISTSKVEFVPHAVIRIEKAGPVCNPIRIETSSGSPHAAQLTALTLRMNSTANRAASMASRKTIHIPTVAPSVAKLCRVRDQQ